MRLLTILLLLAFSGLVNAQFLYSERNGAITITRYMGSETTVLIPSTINGLPVSRIGVGAFIHARITNVTIPDSVTSIGNRAFHLCTRLARVYCRGNAPSIGASLFTGDNNVTVFYLSGTTGWNATFGGRPTELWNPPLPYDYTIDNDTVTITRYTGAGGAVTIPETISFLPVTSIGFAAFADCSGLTSITFQDTVTNIGSLAFIRCGSLTNVIFGGNVKSIGESAFTGTGLKSVAIPDSVTSIGAGVFSSSSSLVSIKISDRITDIADQAFYDCTALTSFTIPNGVTNIGQSVFAYCSCLTNITIGNRVRSLGDYAFEGCLNLMNLKIPNNVTSIGQYSFINCYGLTNVTIGNGVNSIGTGAFLYCSGLADVTLGINVSSIGDDAFLGTRLTGVRFYHKIKTIGRDGICGHRLVER